MAIILVGQLPRAVVVGTILTDGRNKFKVVDSHDRVDGKWFYLENLAEPELRAWFRLADLQELAFEKDPRRKRRRFGARRR